MPDSPSPVEDGREPMTNPPSVSGPAGEDERRMRFIARRVDVIRNNITRVSDTAHLEPDLVFLFDQLSALTARCATLEQEREVTGEDIGIISIRVGMYPGAWDCVPPGEIIKAAWQRLRENASPTPSSGATRP